MQTPESVQDLLELVDYRGADGERWSFRIGTDRACRRVYYSGGGDGVRGHRQAAVVDVPSDTTWLQVVFTDQVSGEVQTGRKWRLSEHMTNSEVVLTAWKAVLTAEEHEARERFRYRGARIFGPHLDVDVLAMVALQRANLDLREEGA